MTDAAVFDESARAPSVILLGGIGSGKTEAIRTLVNTGIEVFMLAIEYPDILKDIPKEKLHWKYIPPAIPDWPTLIDNANKINMLNNKALQDLPGMNQQKYRQFFSVLEGCANFKCDRDGKEYGDVTKWEPNRALVIDSLSGLSILSRDLAVGSKPILSQPDWGKAMDNLERFINLCTTGTRCLFVLTAHTERETDEITGGTSIMASTLGRKLAPKLPRFFTDVIHCKRDGTKFSWSTSTSGMELKRRNLPFSDNLAPDFGPLVENWKKRNGL